MTPKVDIMTDPIEDQDDSFEAQDQAQRSVGKRMHSGLGAARRWFRAFRRTRPFWGGLWCVLAGLWIMRAMNFGFGLAVTGGWNFAAGYILGGGLALFGLVAWFAPHYRTLVGVLAFLFALAAFVSANLGGYLIGTVLGVIGGSMIWAWGEKKPKGARRARGQRGGADGDDTR